VRTIPALASTPLEFGSNTENIVAASKHGSRVVLLPEPVIGQSSLVQFRLGLCCASFAMELITGLRM
jgi:hypothetical protein